MHYNPELAFSIEVHSVL